MIAAVGAQRVGGLVVDVDLVRAEVIQAHRIAGAGRQRVESRRRVVRGHAEQRGIGLGLARGEVFEGRAQGDNPDHAVRVGAHDVVVPDGTGRASRDVVGAA